MKSDTTNKKHNKILSIVIFIILVVAIVLIVGYAYAKYVTSQSGEAQAEIAEWNVAISINDNTNEDVEVDLADTRNKTMEEADVQEGYVAPGTAGKFNIEVNAENSEVSLEYEITMNADYGNNENFPKNLIFYSDENMENAFYHTDNTIELNGFIGYNDSEKKATIPIYWKWAYETGTTDMEKEENDLLDSYWLGKTIEPLTLKVVAKQVNTNQEGNPMANQYAVTLDTNGGTINGYGNSEKVIKQVNYGGQYGELPTPTREGYRFVGWSRNLADQINEQNYTLYHFNNRTTSEFKNDGEFGGLTNQSYIRINGNTSESNIDTYWSITANNSFSVSAGQRYLLSFYARSENAKDKQGFNKYLSDSQRKICIIWSNESYTGLQNDLSFENDGQWHLISIEFTVPEGVTSGKIKIANDSPNIYGPNSYIDIANIQFAEDAITTPYLIQSSTKVVVADNHRLIAKWQKN